MVEAAHRTPEGDRCLSSPPMPDYEYLYDKPYEDRSKVRVAGPFTVESISPHRVLGVDENGDIIAESSNGYGSEYDFAKVVLDNLRVSGVQQAHREGRIEFSSLAPWPGRLVCSEGRYLEGSEGGRHRAACRDIHRPRVRHSVSPGPRGGGARGGRRRLRRSQSPAPSTTRRTRPSSRA